MRGRLGVLFASACVAPGCTELNENYLGPAGQTDGGTASSGVDSDGCDPDPLAGTPLAEAAAEMEPGTWQELITMGFTEELIAFDGDWVGIASNAGAWDPLRRRGLFVGLEFIAYDEATNAWTRAADDPYACSCLEGSDHTTIDPATGTLYHRGFSSSDVFQRLGDGPWESLPQIPDDPSSCCNALEWFPPRSSLIYADAFGIYELADGAWTQIYGSLGFSDRNIVEYSPVHELLFVGSGDRVLVLDADNRIEERAAPPVPIGLRTTVVTPDLVTGNFIVLAEPQRMLTYDPIADVWSDVPGAPPPLVNARDQSVGSVFAIPVTSYCLTMFAAYRFDASKVFLYRH